jgi:hypothetical protein
MGVIGLVGGLPSFLLATLFLYGLNPANIAPPIAD